MSKFVRPENLKFPTIYREFSSKREKLFNFRVQELPEEYFDEAIDLIVKHFMPEETFCVAHGCAEDDEIRHIMIDFYRKLLDRKLSIGCFCDGSVQLIAVNVMETKYSQREKLKFSNQKLNETVEVLEFINEQFDPCKLFQVETYLTSFALCVHPSYRGLGIATEVLKARVEMLKAFNLTVTSTMFTTLGSQIAAEKAGFKVNWMMSYDDLSAKFPSFDFSKSTTKVLKKFSLKI